MLTVLAMEESPLDLVIGAQYTHPITDPHASAPAERTGYTPSR